MAKKTNSPRAFRRAGLHRLECPMCDTYGYFTVAMLEAAGLPQCWREGCGEPLEPVEVELALMLDVDTARVRDLFDRTDDKERSQLRSLGRRGLELKQTLGTLNSMSVAALADVNAERRQEARARRLAAIAPSPEPMCF